MLKIQDLINKRNKYKVDFNYQRPDDAWSLDDKQCLIDTILKGEPMPLFFFNMISNEGSFYVVDGQQRMTTILQFANNKFKLNKKYSGEENHGKTFNGDIQCLTDGQMEQFLNYQLQTYVMEDYDDERVRIIFSRLQRGKPLQLGERLNAKPGKIVSCMRNLAKHPFLAKSIGVSKRRYGVFPDAARILFYEVYGAKQMGSKEIYDFFETYQDLNEASKHYKNIISVLNLLEKCFPSNPGDYKHLEKHAWVLAVYSMIRDLKIKYSLITQEEKIGSFVKSFHSKIYNELLRSSNGTYQRFYDNIRGGWSEKIIALRRDILIQEFLKKHNPVELDDRRQITDEEKISAYGKADGVCEDKDCSVIFKDYKEPEYHHIDLYSEGGRTEIENIKVLCSSCHDKVHSSNNSTENTDDLEQENYNDVVLDNKKKSGVIESILESIKESPKSSNEILEVLIKKFPEKKPESMRNTIRAQIGKREQPTRMEEEKGIELIIKVNAEAHRVYSFGGYSKPTDTSGKKPIGKLVREKLNELIDKNLLSESEVINLQNADYSKRILDLQYPMLKKVTSDTPTKVDRYWKSSLTIHGTKYFVCSEWYEQPSNNDRPYFLRWFKKIKKEN